MKSKKAKHWFHGKTKNAKAAYLKKHTRSIYAGARSGASMDAAKSYRMQVEHMRAEINRLREHMHNIEHDSAQYRATGIQMRMMQRKLHLFKQHS